MTRALIALATLLATASTAAAQARTDFSGNWSAGTGNFEELPLRGDPGVEAGEYVGIPLNEAARQHADAWQPGMHSLLEWQARPHPVTYSMRAPAPNFRMAPIINPDTQAIIGYTIENLFGRADRVIWLDGRAHPSKYAEHLWQGFSTGEYQPDGSLRVTTTHIKYSFVHRNGIPLSPYAQMTEIYKRHGDLLLIAIVVDDPIYLTEPLVRTSTFRLNPAQQVQVALPFEVFDEIPALDRGKVPANPLGFVDTRYAEINKLPLEAARGGAHTMYPEYAKRLTELMQQRPSPTLSSER
ncbi:MAG: hypothetical protein FJW14_11150 [Acidimicrobiia bacterium]|nr:hypothetical protein [Acidimicrobiia bacterium]